MQELRSRLIDKSEQFRKSDMLGPFTTLTGVITQIELELLEKEKEQIMNAHTRAYLIGEDSISIEDANKSSEQYYSETYKQD